MKPELHTHLEVIGIALVVILAWSLVVTAFGQLWTMAMRKAARLYMEWRVGR